MGLATFVQDSKRTVTSSAASDAMSESSRSLMAPTPSLPPPSPEPGQTPAEFLSQLRKRCPKGWRVYMSSTLKKPYAAPLPCHR